MTGSGRIAPAGGQLVDGPFFEDLRRGQVFDGVPAVTLNVGHAALHQSIVGDRMRLALDNRLAEAVTGVSPLAHPALVWDMAIGQSTVATQNVKANLFYRGLVFRRAAQLGDTLHTTTEVVALRQQRCKPGRSPTGLAVLRVVTVDQQRRPILDFWRCAMLPLRNPGAVTAHGDDLDVIGDDNAVSFAQTATTCFGHWDLARFRTQVPGEHFAADSANTTLSIRGGDVVSSAPELARLTLNIASVHHDETRSRRLVYGGHTVGLALSQASRMIPNLVYIVGWHGCDHTAPVYEGDTLHSTLTVETVDPIESGGGLMHLRSVVSATTGPDGVSREVLDWRFVGLMA